MKSALSSITLASVLMLAACSSNESTDADAPAVQATQASSEPAPVPSGIVTPSPSATASGGKNVLMLEGFADLEIGKPVPASSSFKLRGAQASDTCLIYSSPDYKGTYAIVEEGSVRRVTVARDSTVKLIEGVGIGSTEKEVLAAFPGFRAAPHAYVTAGAAKYLTQPGNDPRLRFEIGEDGKVTDIHVGVKPQLLYVEGCS